MPVRARRFSRLLLLVFVVLLPWRPARASQPFTAFLEGFYPQGAGPGFAGQEAWYCTAADLDGDGRAELITGRDDFNRAAAILQVRSFGAGPWDPSTSTDYVLGSEDTPGKCEVGDLNGDGLLDLVVPIIDTLVILPGTAPGQFGPRVTLAVPGVIAVAIADFDGDGIPDLAVACYSARKVQIWKGLGGFAFSPGAQYTTHAHPDQIFAAALNADDKPDLVVSADTVSLALVGDGTGTFAPHDIAGSHATAAGDLNGDGYEDLLTTQGAYLGNGDGSFQPAIAFPTYVACTAADMDEDGKLDLVGILSLSPVSRLSVQHGNGDGTFGPPMLSGYRSTQPNTCAVGDFDGDGHLDFAGAGRNGDADAIRYGYGNGFFITPRQIPLNSPPRYVAAGNFGGDPHPDLLVVSLASNSMGLMLSTGPGSWAAADTLAVPGTPGALGPGIADLNGDGRDDIVMAYSDNAAVSVWLTQPDGHLGPRTDLITPNALTSDLQVVDIDHDGKLDIVYQPGSGGTVALQWLRGLGGGAFAPTASLPFATGQSFAVGDLNGDNLPDVAWPVGTIQVEVALGIAPGVWAPPVTYSTLPTFLHPSQTLIGHFDSDPYPDLAFEDNTTLTILRGQAGGTFGAAAQVPIDGNGGFLSVARDLDGDGIDEIASASNAVGVGILRFRPDGSVLSESVEGTSPSSTALGSIAVADVDGNGTLDIVSGASRRPLLDLLLNRKPPQVLAVRPPVAGRPGVVLAALADPARGSVGFRIATNLSGPMRLELLDVQGRTVRSTIVHPEPGASTSFSFGSAAELPSGRYFARARQGGHEASAPVSVVH